jgi:putative SOS response-associated peptidase YedK
MCGRLIGGNLTQAQMLEIIEGFIHPSTPIAIDHDAPAARTGFNIAPTQQVNLLFAQSGGHRVASTARWWLVPTWFKGTVAEWKATTFNAKIETAAQKPAFRTAWSDGRCVIPATGYYEWSGPKTNRQPHRVYLDQNHPVMLFAGLQTRLRSGLRTCTILTRNALPEIAELHPRMPVLLTADEAERWLNHADDDDHIRASYGLGWEGRVRVHRVARFGPRDDGPELIEKLEDLF